MIVGTLEGRNGSVNQSCGFGKVRSVEEKVTDAALIAASIARPDDFGTLFDRHFDAIHRYLERRLGRESADELAAETFVQAFGARERYDPSRESARPWLFGIAANLARHQRRKEGRRSRAYARAAAQSTSAETVEVDGRIDAAAQGPDLIRGLASLAEPDREALLLYAWADFSYEEVGEALGIPTGTVKSRISRARARLREQLAGSGQVEGGEAIESRHE
jgi:RNA polymerase sigma factor (sigma-70 family)